MDTKKRTIQLIIGPVLFAIASVALKGAIGGPGAMAIGTLLWMVFWWVTQPVALTVTAFLPVGVNAIFGMVEMGDVISQYASGSIMKYGVPFVIARAILVIVLGYAFLKLWPMFGQLSYL